MIIIFQQLQSFMRWPRKLATKTFPLGNSDISIKLKALVILATQLKEVLKGSKNAVVDTAVGLWDMVVHADETIEGINFTLHHPDVTFNIIKKELKTRINEMSSMVILTPKPDGLAMPLEWSGHRLLVLKALTKQQKPPKREGRAGRCQSN